MPSAASVVASGPSSAPASIQFIVVCRVGYLQVQRYIGATRQLHKVVDVGLVIDVALVIESLFRKVGQVVYPVTDAVVGAERADPVATVLARGDLIF